MSGTSRQATPADPQVTPDWGRAAAFWYAGRPHRLDTPPPVAPSQSFQTTFAAARSEVAPTPVTHGWLAGSSTDCRPSPQSSEPVVSRGSQERLTLDGGLLEQSVLHGSGNRALQRLAQAP